MNVNLLGKPCWFRAISKNERLFGFKKQKWRLGNIRTQVYTNGETIIINLVFFTIGIVVNEY